MLKKLAAICAVVIYVGFMSLPAAGAAGESAAAPALTLAASTNGSKVTVTVTGEHLKDLYAYELALTYDTQKLRFQNASAGSAGFSVEPIVKNNEVRVAHTKVGKTAGDNGKLQLAVFTFTGLQNGAAQVTLREAKLVDSKLAAANVSTKSEVVVQAQAGQDSASFKDIHGHWAESSILKAVQQGWVTGYPGGNFLPNKEVTRAEFAGMLIRAVGVGAGEGNSQPLQFTDAKHIPDWSLPFVQEAVKRKIMNGYENGTFGPNRQITRAEIAAMSTRSLDFAVELDGSANLSFADRAQIPAWAKPYIASAVQKGIMHGRSGNLFAPNAHATRAEAVTVILSLLQLK